MPQAPESPLAVLFSAISVQEVPFHDSTFETAGKPLIQSAAPCNPDPLPPLLAVFKSLTSLHEVPFHDSVLAVVPEGNPPKAKPALLIPAPFYIVQLYSYY